MAQSSSEHTSLSRQLGKFEEKYRSGGSSTRRVSGGAGSATAGAMATSRPASLQDINLEVGERGLILGMTRTGKSTLAEVLIDNWFRKYAKSRTIILDSKPRFKAQYELSGTPTWISRRYAQWDWGSFISGSVVIPLYNPRSELEHAWSLGYRIVIAQISKRSDIKKLDQTLVAAYEDRKKRHPLFIYADELNNFFRGGSTGVGAASATGSGIVMAITSGGERSTAFLGAAQRPRWISVEAIESLTKVYWFYTPYADDNKHLKSMGVPDDFVPPRRYYVFNFYDRLSNKRGMCSIKPITRK